MVNIFLSYSRDDRRIMEILRDNLRAVGFNIWIDEEHLEVGTPDWEQAIEDTVRHVDAMVVILSPSAKASKWVLNEIALANAYDVRVFPVLAFGNTRTSVPASLIRAQYADLRGRADYETGFRKLVSGLSAHTGMPLEEFAVDTAGQNPTVIIRVSGHVEGDVIAIGGDVAGDVKIAGGAIVSGDVKSSGEDILCEDEMAEEQARLQEARERQAEAAQALEAAKEERRRLLDEARRQTEQAELELAAAREAEQELEAARLMSHEALVRAREAEQERDRLLSEARGRQAEAAQALEAAQAELAAAEKAQREAISMGRTQQVKAQARLEEARRRKEEVALALQEVEAEWALVRQAEQELDEARQRQAQTEQALQVAQAELAIHEQTVSTASTPLASPPMLEWVDVPDGSVTLKTGQVFAVSPFRMSKYPVTYVQFQTFIDAPDGFDNDQWWEELAVRETEPGKQQWPIHNHPRENVSWYDAVAFCRWLSAKLGEIVRLPTEWEWQRAAQGDDGREYPWGDAFDPKRCNTNEGGVGQTTPVNVYPLGASPFGVMDMAGNGWEWCLNEYKRPANVDVTGDARRVVRGGSWGGDQRFTLVASRHGLRPGSRFFGYGFRVVMSVAGSTDLDVDPA